MRYRIAPRGKGEEGGSEERIEMKLAVVLGDKHFAQCEIGDEQMVTATPEQLAKRFAYPCFLAALKQARPDLPHWDEPAAAKKKATNNKRHA